MRSHGVGSFSIFPAYIAGVMVDNAPTVGMPTVFRTRLTLEWAGFSPLLPLFSNGVEIESKACISCINAP